MTLQSEAPTKPPSKQIEIVPRHTIVQRVVADYYGITLADILSPSRLPPHVKARYVAVHVLRGVLDSEHRAWARLAPLFNRDERTVADGSRKIERLVVADKNLWKEVSEIRALVTRSVKFNVKCPCCGGLGMIAPGT
jgi:chromosomal replication initiation ATPase DnaA